MRLSSTRRCPSPHFLTPLHPTPDPPHHHLPCVVSTRGSDAETHGLQVCTGAVKTAPWLAGGRALACQAAPGEDSRASRPHSGSSSGSSQSAETQGSPPAHSLWHRDDSGRQTGAPDSGEKVTGEESPRGRWEERAEGPRGGSRAPSPAPFLRRGPGLPKICQHQRPWRA